LFEDYKERFLYRNVQSALFWRILNPINWAKFMTTGYGRSNMAADYYDKILFDHATFGDMLANDSPFIMIQATDIIDGYSFTFSPYFFNMMCSDLRQIPVSFAVTASSSYPGAFNGLSLHNYGGSCGSTSRGVKILMQLPDSNISTAHPSALYSRLVCRQGRFRTNSGGMLQEALAQKRRIQGRRSSQISSALS
jgi:hypothetical protein